MIKHTMKYSVLAASLVALIGCGGGGSSSSTDGGSTTPPAASPITGRAIDGPLSGSTVTFETCTDSVTTGTDGKYTAPAACGEGETIVSGGTDTATDLPFHGTLKAPKGATVVTPITTLITALGDTDPKTIATLLGLPAGTDLLTADPTLNQALYAKTVAVHQMVLEIEKTIAAVGATMSAEELNAAASAALAQTIAATAPGTTVSFADPSFVTKALQATFDTPAVKNTLPATVTANVISNVSAMTAKAVATNVAKVETAISTMTNFVAGSDNTTAIKTATKDTVSEVTSSVSTEKLLGSLGALVNLPPAQVATLVTAITEGKSATEVAAAAAAAATAANIPFNEADFAAEIVNLDKFYADYLKVNSLTAAGTSYAIDRILGTTPSVPSTAFNDLALNITGVGPKLANSSQEVSAALLVDSTKTDITLKVSKINLSFNEAGALTGATIPTGTAVTFSSANRTVDVTTNSALDIYSNNSLALNTTKLTALLPDNFKQQVANFAPAGATTVTAIIKPTSDLHVAYVAGKEFSFPKSTLSGFTGFSLKSHFVVQ